MGRWSRWGLGIALAAAACAGPAGLRHRVERGETLYRIGLAYGITPRELARLNGIPDPNRIEVGQVLLIPKAKRRLPVAVITPERARADRPASPEVPVGPSAFLWPVVAGTVTSGFGPRGETHHDGIDIAAPGGAPVRAARDGQVLFSDRLRGYGNLIILEHGDGYATVYAHNRENRARAGETVRRGDTIAEVGSSGKATTPHLHFEIRKDNVARNPLFFLRQASLEEAAGRRRDVVRSGG